MRNLISKVKASLRRRQREYRIRSDHRQANWNVQDERIRLIIAVGAPFLLLCSFIFWATSLLSDWKTAFDILLGLSSPRNTPGVGVWGWLLSLLGWLAVPAAVGVAVGFLVALNIEKMHGDSTREMLGKFLPKEVVDQFLKGDSASHMPPVSKGLDADKDPEGND